MTNTAASTVTFVPAVPVQVSPKAADNLLWSALLSDAGCGVLIYDLNGRIVAGNEAAATLLGAEKGAKLDGSSLHDVMPAPLAEERLAHARKAVEGSEPVILDGMLSGRLTRATMRPLGGESDNELRILEVVRPINAETPKPEGARHIRAKTDDEGEIGRLTSREREVLFHIGRGLSTAEIASTLGRSTKTVEWHRVSLGTKLGITNRVELARIAIRAGLTGVDR